MLDAIGPVFGSVGLIAGFLISLPQLVKTYQVKHTKGVALSTYLLIGVTASCMLVHAISIEDTIFICLHAYHVVVTIAQLWLFWLYRENTRTGFNAEAQRR